MRTYNERSWHIQAKITKKKRQRRIAVSAVSLTCCLILGLVLFLPYDHQAPSASQYRGSEYYPLIQKLNQLSYQAPSYNNNFEKWFFSDLSPNYAGTTYYGTGVPESKETNGTYQEVTDNQVQGVTEADLIKRSDSHIFYLRDHVLSAYSIQGQDSRFVSSYAVIPQIPPGDKSSYYNQEMYLSQDCTTITVISNFCTINNYRRYVYILSLDVTDPKNITKKGELFLSGRYYTSRVTDGKLYLICRHYLRNELDLSDESSYLPGYGTPGDMTYLPMEDIILPETPTSSQYTNVFQLDEQTLKLEDCTALLSYDGAVYASQENIYLARSYINNDLSTQTEITQLSYGEDGLTNQGSFQIEGRVKDQYSMDEKDGILRIVTSTQRDGTTNASLYCIDLTNHSIRASVENFAPKDESVRSVRFDGDKAYVCTSVVLKDPVFFFDLSDLDHITYKDTGTIDGYSMSLVDFSEGYLMGIGCGSSFDTLKIEIYREGETSVESHCKYELENVSFSSDYKAYYIDRENQLIGLGIWGTRYILLYFDGYELVEIMNIPLECNNDTVRAVYIDGYLYVLGKEFTVHKVD